ncbi:hypothetical protein ACWKWN_20475 [Microbacterium trichothecenolyticum]
MTEAVRLVVDGEEFEVIRDGSSIHHTWVSGPNPGYDDGVGDGLDGGDRCDDQGGRGDGRACPDGCGVAEARGDADAAGLGAEPLAPAPARESLGCC